ncbi:YoeB-YefM toxin-antitoxin system antitoxin YefM [Enterobacter hormaechei]|uniref:YoeB-YefM toxin-antitoxin system antitoxin YefM n=1 Tax=Enterobacter hormaechei TaxID=158836 RepID=UPI0007B32BC3|nr:YoeB-YefM toxin-antitoxin system antitoxin YefM [Enterobacter hormaechei]KZP84502.1 prevent-host-death family protein [Enterobacter hormaechei subsp. xiangfangensis]RTM57441.1 YoeB-YefM toxin-antitoxin system antitoxin YefM [Enterobacter hormaechei subsp. xiangfangensis]
MRVISFSEASHNLSAAMLQTTEDHAPVLIVNQNGASCVLMSLDEYNSLEETAYLMHSPANAKRLMSSIESLKAGG